jgi:hypothetical protein
MQTFEADAILPIAADAVWALISDLDNQSLGRGVADRVEVVRDARGVTRTLHLSARLGSGCVVERITELDHQTMRLGYDIVDAGPVPITSYSGLLVCETRGEQMRLSYEARFDGPDPAMLHEMARGNFVVLETNLRAALGLPEMPSRAPV